MTAPTMIRAIDCENTAVRVGGAKKLLRGRMNDGVNVCALQVRALTLGDGCWLKICWPGLPTSQLLREIFSWSDYWFLVVE